MMPSPRPGQDGTRLADLGRGRCAAFSTSGSAAKSAVSGSEKTDHLLPVKPCGKDAGQCFAAPARDCSNGAGHGAVAVRNRLHFSHIARGSMLGLAWRLAPTCGRSGAAGDAERGRSLCLTRAGSRHPGPSRSVAPLALPLPRPVWHVRKLARQLAGQCGSGVAVLAGTARELGQYHKIYAFQCLGRSSGGSKVGPSRHARGRARMRPPARVYARGFNSWNSHGIILINHHVNGTVEGSVGVLSGSGQNWAQFGVVFRGGARLEPNILASENAAVPSSGCHSGAADARSSVMRGRAGESFRVSGLAAPARWSSAAPIEGAPIEPAWARKNGGFLRVSGGASARVGRAMLEGVAYRPELKRYFGMPHQPVRLTVRARAGADRAGHPPYAPIRGGRAPLHVGAVGWPDLDPRFGPADLTNWSTMPAERPEPRGQQRAGVRASDWMGTAATGLGWMDRPRHCLDHDARRGAFCVN